MEGLVEALIFSLVLVLGVLHLYAIPMYAFDSDEPQHLHLAWELTQGHVQYRDFFDNHTPLLPIITEPVVRFIGPRSDILLWSRVLMLPCYAAILIMTFALGSRLFSRRAALWSVALLAVTPSFFFTSIEFRNDNPWLVCWLAILLILTGEKLRPWPMFAAGLMFGVAIGFSMKSMILGGALLIATLAVRSGGGESGSNVQRCLRLGLPFLAGSLLIPGALFFWFMSRHALSNVAYCVFTFNDRYPVRLSRRILGLGMLALSSWLYIRLAAVVAGSTLVDALRRKRMFVFSAAFSYAALVVGLWPIVNWRDMTPSYPLIALFFGGWIAGSAMTGGVVPPVWSRRVTVGISAVVLGAVVIVSHGRLWRDNTRDSIATLAAVLKLTSSSDTVVDLKGETVFRTRAFYLVLERICKAQMRAGLLGDDLERSIVANRAAVAVADSDRIPARVRSFLNLYFIDVGLLRVAGQFLPARAGEDETFDIAVPASYAAVSASGRARGTIDGAPYVHPEFLPAGPHVFCSAARQGAVAILWSPAVARGFSPFGGSRDPPFPWRRVLVLAPHPDDESLATGGLLQRAVASGAVVRVIFATSGEHNSWPQRFVEKKWAIKDGDRARWGAIRIREARAALRQLSVPDSSALFLGYPDSGLSALTTQQSAALSRLLAGQVASFRPDLLVIPSRTDLHPDHRVLGTLARRAVEGSGVKLPGLTEVTYLVHGSPRTDRPVIELNLTPDERIAKKSAILCHSSQLSLSRKRMLNFVRPQEIYYRADVESRPRLAQLQRIWEVLSGI